MKQVGFKDSDACNDDDNHSTGVELAGDKTCENKDESDIYL